MGSALTNRKRNLYRAALSWGIRMMPGDDEGLLLKLATRDRFGNGIVALSRAGTDDVLGGPPFCFINRSGMVPERPTGIRRSKEELARMGVGK